MKSPGRPEVLDQRQAFQHIVETLEHFENGSLTIDDLVIKMEHIHGEQCYSKKHMKRKIIEHVGDSVVVTSVNGKTDIVSLRQRLIDCS